MRRPGQEVRSARKSGPIMDSGCLTGLGTPALVVTGGRHRRDDMAQGAGAFRVMTLAARMADRAGLTRPAVDPGAVLTVTALAAGDVDFHRMCRRRAGPVTGRAGRFWLMMHAVTCHAIDLRRAHRGSSVTVRAGQARGRVPFVLEVSCREGDGAAGSTGTGFVAPRAAGARRPDVVTVVARCRVLKLRCPVPFHRRVAEGAVESCSFEVRGMTEAPSVPGCLLVLDSRVTLEAGVFGQAGSGLLGLCRTDRAERQTENRGRRGNAHRALTAAAAILGGVRPVGVRRVGSSNHGSSTPYSSCTATMLASSRARMSGGLCAAEPL